RVRARAAPPRRARRHDAQRPRPPLARKPVEKGLRTLLPADARGLALPLRARAPPPDRRRAPRLPPSRGRSRARRVPRRRGPRGPVVAPAPPAPTRRVVAAAAQPARGPPARARRLPLARRRGA